MISISGVFNLDGRPVSETDCTVWADARLDYRDELLGAIDLRDKSVNDTELILAAYLRWGETCVEHLHGDFAFAILDPSEKKLFCARDHFGMRPFYYHHAPGKYFVFASDARDIFAVPEVPYAINEGRIADFIVPELEWLDYTSTFYEGVYRLPPGQTVTVTSKGLYFNEYWEPEPGPEIGPMSDEGWQEGFLDVFTRAVDERIRGRSTGVMLSGGMDSGSVAAIANEILKQRSGGPLQTVSAARSDDNCIESNRVRATTRFLDTDAAMIAPDDLGDLDETLTASIEEPFDADFLFMKAIFLRAREQGLDALLDGGGGDVIFNEATYVPRLIRSGKLVTAYREIAAEREFRGRGSVVSEAARYLGTAITPGFVKNSIRPFRQRADAKKFAEASMIDREFAKRVNLDARFERMTSLFPTGHGDFATERVQKIQPNVSTGRERYARLARFAGVEACDPFLDLRVVSFCSRLPGRLLLQKGWSKFILREAMTGKLPDEVRWGTGKPHIGWAYTESSCNREKARGSLTLRDLSAAVEGFIDPERLAAAWREYTAGGDSSPVYTAYILSRWLQQTVNRPVVKNQRFG